MRKFKYLNVTLCCLLTTNAFALDLVDAYKKAQSSAPSLLIEEAGRDASREDVNIALAGLLPSAKFSGSYELYRDDVVNGKRNKSFELSISQNIVNAPNVVGYQKSKQAYSAAELNYMHEQQKLILSVIKNYFGVLDALADVKLKEKTVAAKEKSLEEVTKKYELGMVPVSDVHTAQAKLDSTLVEQFEKQTKLVIAMNTLEELTGTINDEDICGPDVLKSIKKEIPLEDLKHTEDEYINKSMQHNIALKAKRINIEVAKSAVLGKQMEYLPVISGYAGIANKTNVDGELFTKPTTTAGISGSINLLAGGSTTAELKKNQALLRKAEFELESEARSVNTKARLGYRNMNIQKKNIKALEQAVISAKSALDAIQASYELGSNTIQDLLEQQKAHFDMETKLQKAKHQYILAKCELELAVGDLNPNYLMDINKLLKD